MDNNNRVALRILSTDGCLTADPGVASSIPPCLQTFMDIDY